MLDNEFEAGDEVTISVAAYAILERIAADTGESIEAVMDRIVAKEVLRQKRQPPSLFKN